jgi:hypothetical protein
LLRVASLTASRKWPDIAGERRRKAAVRERADALDRVDGD